MKSLAGFLPLLIVVAHGFLSAPLPSPTQSQLNALGWRTAKNFIARRFRRPKPTDQDTMEVVMRDNQASAVQDGAPSMRNANPSVTVGESPTTPKTKPSKARTATADDYARLAETVDGLFAANKPQGAKDLLLKQFAAGVDAESSGPLYWRLVKAHHELCSGTDDPELQRAYLEQGIALANNVCPSIIEADADQTTVAFLLKWKAILLGKLGPFQPIKEKMANSYIIKESLERAQALLALKKQEDSSIYQALGEWCFKVANISFLERQAASVLFGKPPQATYSEALEYFQKGYDLKPTRALATKIAETYQKMGQADPAKEWSEKAARGDNLSA